MGWFKAVGNFFETRTLKAEVKDLRKRLETEAAKNLTLKQTIETLVAKNAALEREIKQARADAEKTPERLTYPYMGYQ